VGLTSAAQLLDQFSAELDVKMTIAAFLDGPGKDLVLSYGSGLYIDEISMVDAGTLERILNRAKAACVVMTGDPFQIPPFQKKGEQLRKWWFESQEYKRREPKVTHLKAQHRLKGDGNSGIREVLAMVETQHRDWKCRLEEHIASIRTNREGADELIVFTNADVIKETIKWAKKHGKTLTKDYICVGMPGVIRKNKIDRAKSRGGKVVYRYRNGTRGEIVAIANGYVKVKTANGGKVVKVINDGIRNTIPNVMSAVAGVVDSAQGKTFSKRVHVVFNTYIPGPAHLVTALSRSTETTTCEINDTVAMSKAFADPTFAFNELAVAFMAAVASKIV
jgi:hypothetical protein